jgi:hypothetical protein
VQFDDSRKRKDYGLEEMQYYKDHLIGFFKFYSTFSYRDYVICPHSGKAVRKDEFIYKIDDDHPVTIAAPLLRRTNCAKYLTNVDLANFIAACRFSVNFIQEWKPPKSSIDYFKD